MDEALPGPPGDATWFVDSGPQAGLLRLLDGISPEAASTPPRPGRANLAAHADHVRYGLELANRALRGEHDAFATADWRRSWTIRSVDAEAWARIKAGLRREYEAVREVLASSDGWRAVDMALTGVLAQIAHVAYHRGAIRQIARDVAG
ncbi:MAG: DinB family protein [Firmicutes bacterium]|nr:DinB family protein [Bacillota bacterium]